MGYEGSREAEEKSGFDSQTRRLFLYPGDKDTGVGGKSRAWALQGTEGRGSSPSEDHARCEGEGFTLLEENVGKEEQGKNSIWYERIAGRQSGWTSQKVRT